MKPARPARLLLTRYTTLPFLLDILLHQSLRFGNPENWEDRNDAYYLNRYREENSLKNLLALCFTTKPETFHHWKIFSSGSSGTCLHFDRDALLDLLRALPGVRCGEVSYHI